MKKLMILHLLSKENSKIFRHFKIRSFFWIQKVFANIQFHLEYLKKLPISKRITGEWTRDTAGGCANYRETTNKNPIHLIQIDRPTEFIVELRAPKEYSGNFQNFAQAALTLINLLIPLTCLKKQFWKCKSRNSCNRRVRKSSVRFGFVSSRLYACPRNPSTWKICFQSFNILSRKNWEIFFRFQLFKSCNISLKYSFQKNSSINHKCKITRENCCS